MKVRTVFLLAVLCLAAACGRFGLPPKAPEPAPAAATVAPSAAAAEEAAQPPAPEDGTAAAETPVPGPEAAAATTPDPAPEPAVIDPANTDLLNSDRVICEEKGGRWSRAGNSRAFTCVYATRDSGKTCTAASDCEGYCLARSRTCAPVTPLFGCHDILSPGGGSQRVCIE